MKMCQIFSNLIENCSKMPEILLLHSPGGFEETEQWPAFFITVEEHICQFPKDRDEEIFSYIGQVCGRTFS